MLCQPMDKPMLHPSHRSLIPSHQPGKLGSLAGMNGKLDVGTCSHLHVRVGASSCAITYIKLMIRRSYVGHRNSRMFMTDYGITVQSSLCVFHP